MAADVMFWFGEYYRARKTYDKAREYFAAILKNYPSGDVAREAMYQLAVTSSEEGRSDDALARFGELVAQFPDSESAKASYLKMAKLMRDRREFDKAIEYYRKVLTADNNESNARIQYEIAETYEEKGGLQQAAEEYLKVPYLYGKSTFWSVKAQLKSAQVFERLGKFDEAKKLYEKLAGMEIEESELAKKRIEFIQWKAQK